MPANIHGALVHEEENGWALYVKLWAPGERGIRHALQWHLVKDGSPKWGNSISVRLDDGPPNGENCLIVSQSLAFDFLKIVERYGLPFPHAEPTINLAHKAWVLLREGL